MTKNLTFLAGKNALQTIRDNGLKPDMVRIIAGAAGGPKWLTLNRLDRILFTEFFKDRNEPLYLIGSSIGAWRFSAMAQQNPLEAQLKFEEAYINQRYQGKPTAAEVTRESWKIMNAFLSDQGVTEILQHPTLKIGFLAVRCRGLSSMEQKLPLGSGLVLAMLTNLFNRNWLKWHFTRTLFHHPDINPPYLSPSELPLHKVKLSPQNYREALLASGSIPLVMEGIKQIAGAPDGIYRDGGLIDYHLDIPYSTKEGEIVLYPHFTERIIPGWLDKAFSWRKPSADHMKNVLLVAPSTEYIQRLPNKKIPDRKDFTLYFGRDDDRIKDWYRAVEQGEELAADFMEIVSSGKIKKIVQPFA